MRYIGIIILLVFCITFLLLTDCQLDTIKPEAAGPTVYPQKWATGTGTAANPWANSCIESAYTACPTGGTIYLRAGYYQLAGQLIIRKAINIVGEGMGKTIVVTADDNGFKIDGDGYPADYTTIKNMTIDGDAQSSEGEAYRCCITVGQSDYILLENIETKNAGRYGVDWNTVNYSSVHDLYTHDNYRHGIHPGTDVAGRNRHNTYRNIYAWNNGSDGFSDRGSSVDPEVDFYNVYDNLQCWDNGRFGIDIDLVSGSSLSNSSVSGNTKDGLFMVNDRDISVDNCLITLNGSYSSEYSGICLANSENVNFTNVIVKNNYYTGIDIEDCSDITFTSCQSYDDRETPLQWYGLELYETNKDISLFNCKLSPNSKGEIYNPNGAVVTIITEKKGASPSVIVRE